MGFSVFHAFQSYQAAQRGSSLCPTCVPGNCHRLDFPPRDAGLTRSALAPANLKRGKSRLCTTEMCCMFLSKGSHTFIMHARSSLSSWSPSLVFEIINNIFICKAKKLNVLMWSTQKKRRPAHAQLLPIQFKTWWSTSSTCTWGTGFMASWTSLIGYSCKSGDRKDLLD